MEAKKTKKQSINIASGAITWKAIKKQKELVLLSIPFVAYVLLFCYVPLLGWIMAFQNYKPGLGFLHSKFIGLDKFKFLFVDNPDFLRVIRNTLAMGVINLVLSFAFAIAFALILNEVVHKAPKKFVQTVSYLPHFLSMIIVCGILQDVLSIDHGIVNEILVKLHVLKEPINFLTYKSLFWWIVGFTNVWKETGWNSIIYIAAITAINPDLYDSAAIDGAGRFRKMWHITLPGIKPTIFILLLINIGNVLNAGFEIQYLLTNGMVQSVSQTIDIYVLKFGISQCDYSLGTAAGIFKSVVSIILIFLANSAAKAAGEERLF
ncbi:MAG: putative aldouronate transport system permease protein [Clostridiales bacterium]|nr:binding-protein-dependent transport system inner rane component [Oscillospiraceae bacterium]MDN5378077.1 putative aldouronate transport system permease protein [Clostridiales bacterium]